MYIDKKQLVPKRILGFTLIELLMVIAIIGILSAFVLASLNVARTKSRDAARVSQVAEIRKALELYYSANGSYIASLESLDHIYAERERRWVEYFGINIAIASIPGWINPAVCKAYGVDASLGNNFESGLLPYLKNSKFAASGPGVDQSNFSYSVAEDGSEYCLGIELENSNNMPSGNNTFCVSGPGNISLGLDVQDGYAIGTTQSYMGDASFSVCLPH